MRAVLFASGCCGRYRGQLVLRPEDGVVVTLDAFAKSKAAAAKRALDVAETLIEGFRREEVIER